MSFDITKPRTIGWIVCGLGTLLLISVVILTYAIDTQIYEIQRQRVWDATYERMIGVTPPADAAKIADKSVEEWEKRQKQ